MVSTSDHALEDKRLLARVKDAVSACETRYAARFIGFLDERQTAVVRAFLEHSKPFAEYRFFGGHEDAERVILGVFSQEYPVDVDAFPLAAVGFRFREEASITHRDVLGSLIGCGIVRDKVGDILCEKGLAVAFVHEDLSRFIADNVTKIGREGVTVQLPYEGTLPAMHTFVPVSGTLASARLDAVLKVLLGCSREQACEKITSALVSVNHRLIQSVSAPVKEGDLISVRGSGRFAVRDMTDTTKKGRLILRAEKYQ